jgi:hypothetical protein
LSEPTWSILGFSAALGASLLATKDVYYP